MDLHTFLLVLSVVLLGLAAFKTPEPQYVSYGWMGLFIFLINQFKF